MMRPRTSLYIIFAFFFQSCQSNQDNLLEKLLHRHQERFPGVLEQPGRYGVQIIYTQVDRDRENRSVLKDYRYRVDPAEYFYPASTVKLPVALLALERIHELEVPGLTKYALMLTDSAWSGQTPVRLDSVNGDPYPSVARYIKKIFLVSDNDAFNRLYEFLGPDYINGSLHEKGYTGSRIIHRLSIPLTPEENRYTNPVRFYDEENSLVYRQGLVQATGNYGSPEPVMLGDGYVSHDSLIMEPMDFTAKNFIPLEELHRMLVAVVFPDAVKPYSGFRLSPDDREFILTYMSMYPRESKDPSYGEKYDDNYCKFLMFGDRPGRIPGNIRIFNKIGLAYGFLVESAYIVDFDEKIEFFLSAVIYVNNNRIYNDGVYEYDSIGFPFMGNLGRMIYEYELERDRPRVPDLSEWRSLYEN